MRILQLTPGTGNFYCGPCLRDNALTLALRRRGHLMTLLPLYLPHMTELSAAEQGTPIFFGGVNVFLQQKIPLFRHTPWWLDRWLDSPALLRAVAQRTGATRARDLGAMTVSMLRGEEGNQVKELDKLLAWLKTQPAPDIVSISNSMLLGVARRLRRELGAKIVCTLQGEDSFLDSLQERWRDRAWGLLSERAADADHFIAVSRYMQHVMQRRAAIPAEKISVIYNGIVLDGFAPADVPSDPPVIGFLAHMGQINGLDTLVNAFILLKQRGRIPRLKLRAAGSLTAHDEPFLTCLKNHLRKTGFGDDAEFHANLDRGQKIAFLRGLTLFSVPATYGEAFGLYVIEALACGVPVVQPRHGAFPELLEATGGGILVEPNDPAALADGLEALLLDSARARKLGVRGRMAVREKFSVEVMAQNVENVFRQTIGR